MKLQLIKESLRTQIVTALRGEIISGKFSPGEQLIERQLAKRFGVSVAPVREALLRLVHDGFLQSSTHRSVTVSQKVSPATSEVLRNIRLELEISALRLGISELDMDRLDESQVLLDRLHLACQQPEPEEIVQLDFALHRSIFEIFRQPDLLIPWTTTMATEHLKVSRVTASADLGTIIYEQHSRFLDQCRSRQLKPAIETLKENILSESSAAIPKELRSSLRDPQHS